MLDEGLGILFLLVAFDHCEQRTRHHLTQVAQRQLGGLLWCLGQIGLVAVHLQHRLDLTHASAQSAPCLARDDVGQAWRGGNDALPPLLAQGGAGGGGCEPLCVHFQRLCLVVDGRCAQGKGIADGRTGGHLDKAVGAVAVVVGGGIGHVQVSREDGVHTGFDEPLAQLPGIINHIG